MTSQERNHETMMWLVAQVIHLRNHNQALELVIASYLEKGEPIDTMQFKRLLDSVKANLKPKTYKSTMEELWFWDEDLDAALRELLKDI